MRDRRGEREREREKTERETERSKIMINRNPDKEVIWSIFKSYTLYLAFRFRQQSSVPHVKSY